ncbi:MAG: hypothetical protein ACFFD1_12040, partial [Candidatus Thorarchaeota archaeon]
DDLMVDLIPKNANKLNVNYFFKKTYEDEVLVKLVCDNTIDSYNRPVAKSHCLLIPKNDYISKGLRYFISPLIISQEKLLSDEFLVEENDFRKTPIRITIGLKEVIQAVLMYEHVFFYLGPEFQEQYPALMEFLANIEYFLPKKISDRLKIKSFINLNLINDINIGITFDNQIFQQIKDNDTIIFRVLSNNLDLIATEPINLSPIIDDIVNMSMERMLEQNDTVKELYTILFSSDKRLDPRIDYNLKEKILTRWNQKKSKNLNIRDRFKKDTSRNTPKTLP